MVCAAGEMAFEVSDGLLFVEVLLVVVNGDSVVVLTLMNVGLLVVVVGRLVVVLRVVDCRLVGRGRRVVLLGANSTMLKLTQMIKMHCS